MQENQQGQEEVIDKQEEQLQVEVEQEWYDQYKQEFINQISCSQQMYSQYQTILRFHSQIIQANLNISEKFIILILDHESHMTSIAKKLQKEIEYRAQWSLLIKFLSSKGQQIENKQMRDEINHYLAKTFLQDKQYQRASNIYLQKLMINQQKVSQRWIPTIIETFKKLNDYVFISNFCIKQYEMNVNGNADYYLLLNIFGKRADQNLVKQFIQEHNIQQLIDDIILNFRNKVYLLELYNKSVRLYNNKDKEEMMTQEYSENESQKFFYSLLSSYSYFIKQQNYPNSIYIGFLMQLKSLSDDEEKDNLNLEIAKTYEELREFELAISYYEQYLLKKPSNLGVVFDLYYQYQSSENRNISKRMYDFFKTLLLSNPQQTVYYGILIQENNMSFSQLKSLIQEYLSKNMKYSQYLLKFIDFINNTIFTQNSFFNNRDLLQSYIRFELENANTICQRVVYNKFIIPQLIYQPKYSVNDLYFD